MARLNKVEILRSKPGTISGLLPAGVELPVYTAMMQSAFASAGGPDARTLALADGKCDGFLMRAVRDSGTEVPTTDTERLYGFTHDGVPETPFRAGFMGTIERCESLTAEGELHVLESGTGLINDETEVDTPLSFSQGRFCVAQPGQIANWLLRAQLTPEDNGDDTNPCKIQVEECPGFLVPEA